MVLNGAADVLAVEVDDGAEDAGLPGTMLHLLPNNFPLMACQIPITDRADALTPTLSN